MASKDKILEVAEFLKKADPRVLDKILGRDTDVYNIPGYLVSLEQIAENEDRQDCPCGDCANCALRYSGKCDEISRNFAFAN